MDNSCQLPAVSCQLKQRDSEALETNCFFNTSYVSRRATHAVTLKTWTPPFSHRAGVGSRCRMRGLVRFVRGRTNQAHAHAVDYLPVSRLSRPAAALQGGAGVPEAEVRASLAHRPTAG